MFALLTVVILLNGVIVIQLLVVAPVWFNIVWRAPGIARGISSDDQTEQNRSEELCSCDISMAVLACRAYCFHLA